jgi:hypothetical protein
MKSPCVVVKVVGSPGCDTRVMLLICHRAVVCDVLRHIFWTHLVGNRDWLSYAQNMPPSVTYIHEGGANMEEAVLIMGARSDKVEKHVLE